MVAGRVYPVLKGASVEARYLEQSQRVTIEQDGLICEAGDITFLLPLEVLEEQIKKLRARVRERNKKEDV